MTENGYGKRTPVGEYTRHAPRDAGDDRHPDHRTNGTVVAATLVKAEDEMMVVTTGGEPIRTRVKGIRPISRATQGVTLINLDKGETLISLEKVAETDNEEELGD